MYPYPAGDLVIRAAAHLITTAVNEIGTPDDFVGQVGEVFVVITTRDRGASLRDVLVERFGAEIAMHYDFQDRQRGYMLVRGPGGQERRAPLMSLAVKLVTDENDPGDIRDII
jgi:rRNA processing protein Gar1